MYENLDSELVWTIRNKELQRANAARTKLAQLVEVYEFQMSRLVASKTTYGQIRERISDLEDMLKSSHPTKSFDRIVKQDISRTVSNLKTYYDFFEPGQKGKKVSLYKLLSALFGTKETSDVYRSLIGRLRSFRHEDQHEHDMLQDEFDSYAVETNLERNRELARTALKNLIPLVEEYVKRLGLHDERFERVIDLTPITDSLGGFWKAGTREMGISEEAIGLYKNPKTGIILPQKTNLVLTTIHEYFHSLAQQISERSLPVGMNNGAKGYCSITQNMVSEGVSMMMEKMCIGWFEKPENRKRVEMTNKEIKLMRLAPGVYLQKRILEICHTIFHIEENENPNLKAHERLALISGVQRYGLDEFLFEDPSMTDILGYLNYPMGYKHVEGIMSDIRRKYGLAFERKNKGLIVRGLLTAGMTPDAQKEFFFTEYMPRVAKYFNKNGNGKHTHQVPASASLEAAVKKGDDQETKINKSDDNIPQISQPAEANSVENGQNSEQEGDERADSAGKASQCEEPGRPSEAKA